MLKDEQVKAIVAKELVETSEVCEVLQRYIYDHKDIDAPIVEPTSMGHLILMNHMYGVAADYYFKKFNL